MVPCVFVSVASYTGVVRLVVAMGLVVTPAKRVPGLKYWGQEGKIC